MSGARRRGGNLNNRGSGGGGGDGGNDAARPRDDAGAVARKQASKAAAQAKIKFEKKPAWLDHGLTAAFLAQGFYVPFACYNQAGFYGVGIYFGLLVVVAAVIEGSKWFAGVFGAAVSSRMDSHPLANAIDMKKFQEQFWQLVVHASMALMEWRLLANEAWWGDGASVWQPTDAEEAANPGLRAELAASHPLGRPCFHTSAPAHVPDLLLLCYWTQLAVWVYTCYVHRFRDEPRKDYFVMYLHHVMTIALVAGSAASGMFRVGLLVLFVHDFSDIFVDSLKLANYLDLGGPKKFFLSEIAYITCLGMWLWQRLLLFPTVVIKNSLFISHEQCAAEDDWFRAFFPTGLEFWGPSNVMLVALLCLHCWWFFLLCRIGYKLLTQGDAKQAGREEYEGDSD